MVTDWLFATFTFATVVTSFALSLNETLRLLYPVWYNGIYVSVVCHAVRVYSVASIWVRQVASHPDIVFVRAVVAEWWPKRPPPPYDLLCVRGGHVVHRGYRRDLFTETYEKIDADFLVWSYDDGLGDPVPRFHVLVSDVEMLRDPGHPARVGWDRPAVSPNYPILCEVTFGDADADADADANTYTFSLLTPDDQYLVVGNTLTPAFFTYLFHVQCGISPLPQQPYHIQLMDNGVTMYTLNETQSLVIEENGWKVVPAT